MSSIGRSVAGAFRITTMVVALILAAQRTVSAQGAGAATPGAMRPAVCATGVKVYANMSQVPTPYDTIPMPPFRGQVIITNEEEAAAAELAMRGRAGSVGATGVVAEDDVQDDGAGRQTVRSRRRTAVFVPSDSARARKACAKS